MDSFFALFLSGTSHGTAYGFTLEFCEPIVKAESKWNTNGRYPIFTLAKANKDADYWPRLTKDKAKNNRITVDWSKWVEEDEEAEAPAMGGDFDPSMMQGFGGGMPGMGGKGGMGVMDMEEMMKQYGGAQGMPDSDDEDEEENQVDPHHLDEDEEGD